MHVFWIKLSDNTKKSVILVVEQFGSVIGTHGFIWLRVADTFLLCRMYWYLLLSKTLL